LRLDLEATPSEQPVREPDQAGLAIVQGDVQVARTGSEDLVQAFADELDDRVVLQLGAMARVRTRAEAIWSATETRISRSRWVCGRDSS
jgi:hypothetical protein